MRKLLFLASMLIVAFIAIEISSVKYAQNKLENMIYENYENVSDCTVRINSFPFMVSVAKGSIDDIKISTVIKDASTGIDVSGHFRIRGMSIKSSDLLTGNINITDIKNLSARADIEESELKKLSLDNVNDINIGENGVEAHLEIGDAVISVMFHLTIMKTNPGISLTFRPVDAYDLNNASFLAGTKHADGSVTIGVSGIPDFVIPESVVLKSKRIELTLDSNALIEELIDLQQ